MEKSGYKTVSSEKSFEPALWGIPDATSEKIHEAFGEFRLNFHQCFDTKTCNNSHYAWEYIRGLVIMRENRNFANITRQMDGIYETSDGLHHFMSNSPWSAQPAYDKIQRQIAEDGDFNGGILSIDESCDERNSENCAGASKQYNSRFGKTEISQTAVCLGYYSQDIWTMLSGELYIPEKWFSDGFAALRVKTGISDNVNFITKSKMALRQIERAVENGIKSQAVVGDTTYGRDGNLRKRLAEMGLNYLLDVPAQTLVYLKKPVFVKSKMKKGKKERRKYYPSTTNGQKPIHAKDILRLPALQFQTVPVRNTERGPLENDFHARRVWILNVDNRLTEEWLLLRRQNDGKISYSLSNAPENTSLKQLALWKCNRYFIERIFEDSKNELGWDELEARKYLSWDHHTALTALALWFIASLKLDWKRSYPADPEMAREFEVNVLPGLSTRNVRELFRSAFDMSNLTEQETRELIRQNLKNRARSTASRLKHPKRDHGNSE